MAGNADGEAVECTQNHECGAHIAVSSALPLPRCTCKVSSALPRRRRGREGCSSESCASIGPRYVLVALQTASLACAAS